MYIYGRCLGVITDFKQKSNTLDHEQNTKVSCTADTPTVQNTEGMTEINVTSLLLH